MMAALEIPKEFREGLRSIAANWAVYTALGTFALYVLGYLALRFHLTTLGVATDLEVLNERYLFIGTKCVVYLLSFVPIIVLLVIGPLALVYLRAYRATQRAAGDSATSQAATSPALPLELMGIVKRPAPMFGYLSLLGTVISVLLIQIVMRKTLELEQLLLAPRRDQFLSPILFAPDPATRAPYFAGLVFGCLITWSLLFVAWQRERGDTWGRFLTGLCALMVGIQTLFLPINYGVLVLDKSFARVREVPKATLPGNAAAIWLIWEGKDTRTFLVRPAPMNPAPLKAPVGPAVSAALREDGHAPRVSAGGRPRRLTRGVGKLPATPRKAPAELATGNTPSKPGPPPLAPPSQPYLITVPRKDSDSMIILGLDHISALIGEPPARPERAAKNTKR